MAAEGNRTLELASHVAIAFRIGYNIAGKGIDLARDRFDPRELASQVRPSYEFSPSERPRDHNVRSSQIKTIRSASNKKAAVFCSRCLKQENRAASHFRER